ncbi:VOC family protein [Frankia sp. Hr75.2]|nr:VOC family protein [Frankia sp. Hr75.2]
MTPTRPRPVVHLELHTPDLDRATSFYLRLLGWHPQVVETGNSPYVSVDVGMSGGIVECGTAQPLWIPYVEVTDVARATARACALGASILLAPREGPTGWRSVMTSYASGQIAFWQPKAGPS